MECVDHLVTLLNSPSVSERFDWQEIERGLGHALPDDYKNLVEAFPAGFFQGVIRLIRPGDHRKQRTNYLGRYTYRLEDMRRWREQEPSRFPWPIYPEPGGVLPWGRSRREDLFFWLTGADDPNAWPVVLADREFESWTTVESNICGFLTSVVSGGFDVGQFSYEPIRREPWFDLTSPSKGPQLRIGEQFWASPRGRPDSAVTSQFSSLVELLSKSPRNPTSVAWGEIERRLGSRLPVDYKSFIETFGAGTVSDLTITSPEACGAFDLFDRIAERGKLTAGHLLRGIMVPPVHPEPGGLIPWGYLEDGWCCGWVPLDPNPEAWGTVAVPPSMVGYTFEPGLSFSAFIIKYLTESGFRSFQGRSVQPATPTLFRPRLT